MVQDIDTLAVDLKDLKSVFDAVGTPMMERRHRREETIAAYQKYEPAAGSQ